MILQCHAQLDGVKNVYKFIHASKIWRVILVKLRCMKTIKNNKKSRRHHHLSVVFIETSNKRVKMHSQK